MCRGRIPFRVRGVGRFAPESGFDHQEYYTDALFREIEESSLLLII